MLIPRQIKAFRDALLAVEPVPISIPGIRPPLLGHPGIRESTRIEYNKRDSQLLGRWHEYSFGLPGDHILELSLQLYESGGGYWRLFAYSVVDGNRQSGMLFSVNFTHGNCLQDEVGFLCRHIPCNVCVVAADVVLLGMVIVQPVTGLQEKFVYANVVG